MGLCDGDGPEGFGMRVYLCGAFQHQEEMRERRNWLEEFGYEVCSSWIDVDFHEDDGLVADDFGLMPRRASVYAHRDLREIDRCDLLVCFTEPEGSKYTRGGRHVELGYAQALGKMIVVVGREETIFHCLADYQLPRFELPFFKALLVSLKDADVIARRVA